MPGNDRSGGWSLLMDRHRGQPPIKFITTQQILLKHFLNNLKVVFFFRCLKKKQHYFLFVRPTRAILLAYQFCRVTSRTQNERFMNIFQNNVYEL